MILIYKIFEFIIRNNIQSHIVKSWPRDPAKLYMIIWDYHLDYHLDASLDMILESRCGSGNPFCSDKFDNNVFCCDYARVGFALDFDSFRSSFDFLFLIFQKTVLNPFQITKLYVWILISGHVFYKEIINLILRCNCWLLFHDCFKIWIHFP